ncbi:RteC domain-containing protein [Mucilaginibacter sp. X5P1]|uniref:RteC domain-containing protein n=1 Tax=Mucilaginibacter sp. X5P1 TaxID=2723088 RepID=UPI00161A6D52|nr:RteC domain-containing protein [Mucilaginibacter sp. X5P1]MBB6141677.1 hypothetical protein [Mucilaginibacter sp. X5P1]
MKEDIFIYSDLGTTPIKRLTGGLNTTGESLKKLKDFVKETPFENQLEEIRFFKYEKPRFVAEQIYALEIYTIETGKPLGDELLIRNFYEQELRFIKRYFIQYQFLYQYYQLDACDLDHLFFVRGAKPSDILIPEAPGLDPVFSTSCDYLFAKFMAYERIQDYIMDCLYGQGKAYQSFTSKKGRSLTWTGDKSNLIELAYAIYDTLQINNGEVDISDIIDWLEQSLQVNLGRYYKRFSEIKMRKNISRTRYLDFMVEMIVKHMEEGDGFQPQPLKAVSGSKLRP